MNVNWWERCPPGLPRTTQPFLHLFHPIPATGWAPLARDGDQDTTARAEPPARSSSGPAFYHELASMPPFLLFIQLEPESHLQQCYLFPICSCISLPALLTPPSAQLTTPSPTLYTSDTILELPTLSALLTPPSPHSLHHWHHLFPTPSPRLSTLWMSKLFPLAFDWWWCCASKRLFNRHGYIVRSKSFPPVSVLFMRVISARSSRFGPLSFKKERRKNIPGSARMCVMCFSGVSVILQSQLKKKNQQWLRYVVTCAMGPKFSQVFSVNKLLQSLKTLCAVFSNTPVSENSPCYILLQIELWRRIMTQIYDLSIFSLSNLFPAPLFLARKA